MKRRNIISLFLLAMIALAVTSCRTSDKLIYLSDAQRDSATAILQQYSTIIMPGDELSVDIVSISPESLYQFYIRAYANGRRTSGDIHDIRTNFIVSQGGTINIPLLGDIPAIGITTDSLAHDIEHRLKDGNFVDDPMVTVARTNFRVTVLGEVRKPTQINVEDNRITILEALAIAGDITSSGMRDCVRVMRENNGQQDIGTIDLTSRELLDSPYYYLQQNDIVYIEPDKNKKRRATYNPNIPAYISMGTSIISLITNLTYRIQRSDRFF